jgi:hypothetical protein
VAWQFAALSMGCSPFLRWGALPVERKKERMVLEFVAIREIAENSAKFSCKAGRSFSGSDAGMDNKREQRA